jgi:DNA topoisomerase-3
MGKALIIAEKPSVAQELSRTLAKAPGMSGFKKHKDKDYFENETHIISAAIGHLVELPLPTEGGRAMRWDMDKLPIIPGTFDLKPIDKTKQRFSLLKKLMSRKDVDLLINACDAGREGELIFRYLVEAAGVDKPINRLWMQSMTSQALVEAFGHLRSDGEMLPLAAAARCRSESDWLVGINGTRALTAYYSRHGGFVKTPVGRVQTPTLTILVKREKEIQRFTARTYYEVHADFEVAAGTYASRWFEEGFRKSDDPHARAERLWDPAEAEAIVERCRGREGIVEESSKPKKQSPPLLYDLTSLQREASNRFGFSARRTLQIAQSLYEKHKALTYPRTDSRFLPGDYTGVVIDTMKTLAGAGGTLAPDLAGFAGRVVEDHMVKGGNRRIFNDAKVSDHFAIIPTGKMPGSRLSEAERKIYDAVTRRFVAVFFKTAEFLVTTRITRVERDAFKTEGKVLVEPGWLAVYGKDARSPREEGEERSAAAIVPVLPSEKARNTAIDPEKKETKPPPRYTEATLLSAMEGAGKLVDDEELRAAMSERGLGTPATRAAIIEGLIHDKYVQRDRRHLVATTRGIGLVDQLETIGLDTLCAPELTGEWEFKLKEMEHGGLDRDTFMEDIRSMTRDIVERIRAYIEEVKGLSFPDLDVTCPKCGTKRFTQTDAHFSCASPDCRFRIRKTVASRRLSDDEARRLIADRAIGPLKGFRSRAGKEFTATLRLDEDEDYKVTFAFDEGSREDVELNDPIAECPLCREAGRRGHIHDTADAYVCEQHFEESKCPAKLPKTLLSVDITREQAVKFFGEGRTDVIEKFISRKRGRTFSASLKLNLKGKKLIEWEFPPRQGRAGRTPGRKAAPKVEKA